MKQPLGLALAVSMSFLLWTGGLPAPADAAAKPVASRTSVTRLSTNGGTKVTITGSNLRGVRAVYFGVAKTTRITHLSSTKLVVRAPRHKAGKVTLKLRTASRTYTTAIRLSYVTPANSASAFEAEVFRLTNLRRGKPQVCVDHDNDGNITKRTAMPAVRALTWNSRLGTAARAHSRDMATKNYFSHTSADGRTLTDRLTQAGYDWSWAGENIAAGYSTPSQVVTGWMTSYGHCTNLMSNHFTELGVGYAYATGSTYHSYWTQDFGSR